MFARDSVELGCWAEGVYLVAVGVEEAKGAATLNGARLGQRREPMPYRVTSIPIYLRLSWF